MKILVPVDGSETSFRALDFAIELADRFDGSLHVVHFSDEETDATTMVLDRAHNAIADASQTDASPADEPEVELVDLDIWTDAGVGKAIVEFASEEGYDHVVMGHHGNGAVGRAILGSAAESVVRSKAVPVTIVP